jgi:hypothetical protein
MNQRRLRNLIPYIAMACNGLSLYLQQLWPALLSLVLIGTMIGVIVIERKRDQ